MAMTPRFKPMRLSVKPASSNSATTSWSSFLDVALMPA